MSRCSGVTDGNAAVGPHAGPIIISVGRLLPHKRQAILIEAIAHLGPSFDSATLWIVGSGASRNALEQERQRLGVRERVVFWGHRADVPALLAQATIFANASSWEGMSNAVLEAMALGLPSVVADAPGVSECHVNGETGLIVSGASDQELTEQFSKALQTLLADPALQRRLGDSARARARERYSMEANRQRFLDAYRRIAVGSA